MIDSSFVQKIIDIHATQIVKTGVQTFSTDVLHNLPLPTEPSVVTLTVSTLKGFTQFCGQRAAQIDNEPGAPIPGIDTQPLLIHVVDHATVRLLGPIWGEHRHRDIYIQASAFQPGKTFQYGQYMDLEQFIISMQSLFVEGHDRERVLRFVGNIRDETVKTNTDDGYTQTAVVKTGITLGEEAKVPNPVTLAPFRTFPELDQPASKFILRLAQDGRGKLTAGLFEADGGKWKIDAIASIETYLKSSGVAEDIAILA